MDNNKQLAALVRSKVAVDIGSTVVKIARMGQDGTFLSQDFYPRDFEAGIARQVESLLDQADSGAGHEGVLVCSSANGGLRVGIVCLTHHFSGAELRNQVLSAGANPVYLHSLDEACGEEGGKPSYVDILLVAGGIDCVDAAPLEARLRRFRPDAYRFGTLAYAGNKYLADLFVELFPDACVIANPLAQGLGKKEATVFEAVRRAYLDDLVYKEGVSELRSGLAHGIRPTPEVVNRGFQRAMQNGSSIKILGACVLLDIGGATTDLHYSVEMVRDESEDKPFSALSVARYVFTDLGIVASRDSLLMQMRAHPRLYDLLDIVLQENVREAYRLMREGEYDPSPELLSYACLFLALDRFAHGQGTGLPQGNLERLEQIILTGGAAQALDEELVSRMLRQLLPVGDRTVAVLIDRRYQIWIDGITWPEAVPV